MQRILMVLCSLMCFGLSSFCFASDEPPINKVTLELKAEQWVKTKTVLVTVGINAALTDKAFEKIHDDILNKLKTLSSQTEWNITAFNRSVDKTGLEQLQAQASTRLSNDEIANLRNKAKSISKPGETFTIEDIQYSPSEAEITEAKALLRENIYQQINAELTKLNKDFPAQKYYLYDVNFVGSPIAMTSMISLKVRGDAINAPALTVSDKLQQNAIVTLAAMMPNGK